MLYSMWLAILSDMVLSKKQIFLTSYPSREEQQRWLKVYYRARGMDETLSNDTNCHLVDQFSVLVHLTWGFWGLVQSHIFEYRL